MRIRFAVVSFVLFAAAVGLGQDKDKGKDEKLTPKQRSASKLVVKAAEVMQRKEWDAGIRLLDSALRLDPDNVNGRWMRGLGYLKKGDPDQAIADFANALKRDAKMAPAYRDRGLAYMEKKEYDRALADFDEYIKLRPTDPEGYEERAHAHRAKGSKDKAEADARKAKELRDKAEGKKKD
jgi:tetratricopeptide (TPR) repeat protein